MRSILTATVLALLCVSQVNAEDNRSRLVMTGTGRVSAEPDIGYISVAVVSRHKDSTEATSANSKAMKQLQETLKALGIKANEMQTTEFDIREETRQVERVKGNQKTIDHEFVGFIITNQVQITVCDLKNMGKVLDAAVKDGANRVNRIHFGSSKAKEHLEQARRAAVKDAIQKAKVIAEELGVALDEVIEVSEPTRYYGRPEAAYDRGEGRSMTEVPVAAGSMEFTIQVNVSWKLKQTAQPKERR
jgi:uncharacterized protein YggE